MRFCRKHSIFSSLAASLVILIMLTAAAPVYAAQSSEVYGTERVTDTSGFVEEVIYDGTSRQPRFIKGILSPALDRDEDVLRYVQSGKMFAFNWGGESYRLVKKQEDEQQQLHFLYQQLWNNIPVHGNFLNIHLNTERQVRAVLNSSAEGLTQLDQSAIPMLEAEQAIAGYKAHLQQKQGQTIEFGGAFHDIQISPPTAELQWYGHDGTYSLVYVVEAVYVKPEIGSWVGFVDAKSGQVIFEYSRLENLDSNRNRTGTGDSFSGQQRQLNIYLDNTSPEEYVLVDNTKNMTNGGYIITVDEHKNYPVLSRSTKFTDKHGVDAHYNTGLVYDYYKRTFSRDSLDGAGMTLASYIHHSVNYDNAYWLSLTRSDGSKYGFMVYGDGNGITTNCMSCELDVVAHELTHGVTSFSADLQYFGQSGALNESFSDIMAAVIDGNWTVGEDTGTVFRDMSNPNQFKQPKHMKEYVNTVQDNRGVHVNSGIPNRAAYLTATKLDQAGLDGKSLTGRLAYYALTRYLNPSSKFIDARNAFILAVDDLGFTNSTKTTIRNAVDQAWKEVGIPYQEPIADDSYEPNGSITQAKTITPGTVSGTLITDDIDYYKFVMGGNVSQNVYAHLYGNSGDMAAVLYKDIPGQNAQFINVTDSVYGAAALKLSIAPGTYYWRVDTQGSSFDSKGPYNLFFATDNQNDLQQEHLTTLLSTARQLLVNHAYMAADKNALLSQAITSADTVTGSVYPGKLFDGALKLSASIRSFTDGIDKTEPSWAAGSGLSVTGVTTSGMTISWPNAQDDQSGVNGYRLYIGDNLYATVATNVYEVKSLSANSSYSFVLQAGDNAGNWTSSGLAATFKTTTTGGGGGGGSGGGGGGGGFGTVPVVTDGTQLTLSEAALKAGSEGQVNIQVSKQEVVLPINTPELLGNNRLRLQMDNAFLLIDSSVFKRLVTMLGPNIGTDAQLVFRNERLSSSESQRLLETFAVPNTIVKPMASVYNFELKAISNGQTYTLNDFEKSVELKIAYDANSVNPDLLGVYYYNETSGQWDYVGGAVDANISTIGVKLPHFSKYTVLEWNKSYDDVPTDHWVASALRMLTAQRIVTGTSNTQFSPNGKTTRAEFSALLSRALGLQQSSKLAPFRDVDTSAWYVQSVTASYEAGLIRGRSDTEFAPDDTITREEMATMLVRAYELKTGGKPQPENTFFSDSGRISEWAKPSVMAAATIGLMKGTGSDIFAPQELTTRAQSAQAIYNMLQK